jgi:hypothetical protein
MMVRNMHFFFMYLMYLLSKFRHSVKILFPALTPPPC